MNDFYSAIGKEADAYYARNGGKIERQRDPVLESIRTLHALSPIRRILEIGCSTGWRLAEVNHETNAAAVGLEASQSAVAQGRIDHPEIQIIHGVAPRDLVSIPASTDSEKFDCIVVGFIEYLIPRDSLFLFASEVDRLLTSNGYLIVFDFLTPRPTRREYTHDDRLSIYKLNPSAAWTWSPTYFLINRELFLSERYQGALDDPANWMTVDTLRKFDTDSAYPLGL